MLFVLLGVLVCLNGYNKIQERHYLINNRKLLFAVLEAKNLKPGYQNDMIMVFFWVGDFAVFSHGSRARELCGLFLKALV